MVGNANASPMTVGDGQGGRYELLGRLAMGGMAELHLARALDDGHGPPVVLKRILPHLAEDPDFVRMFRDEAHLAAQLRHPNIVQVRDIGRDGENWFFTMEYVHGENLRTILKAVQQRGEHIPLAHVLTIALGVTAALHYAHEQVDEHGQPLRIVHRDVSPTNVLVARDGGVKLVDFGIAKAAAATHITQAGMLKGKASYMSPEQCRADPVDRRSDVFSMGILLYEMSTLTRLFRGDNELIILNQVLTGQKTPPSQRRDDYPPELEHIVMRALHQQPDMRYQTALQMQQDLERFAAMHAFTPSHVELARYVHALFGPKPLPWGERQHPAPHGEASDSGIGTQVDPLDDDQTAATSQRDVETPPPRARGASPRRGASTPPRLPTGPRPRATGSERLHGDERSPATPGRRSPWMGRRPNADPAARPHGAPQPAAGLRAGARAQAVKPAPRPQPKTGRVPALVKARITPAPRPGAREPSERPVSANEERPVATRSRGPSRITGPYSSSPPPRQPPPPREPPPRQPPPRQPPPPREPQRTAPPPSPPLSTATSTGPPPAAIAPSPAPAVRSPSGVDKTQFTPTPARARFAPPFLSEAAPVVPQVDKTQFAATPALGSTVIPTTASSTSHAQPAVVDRTMVSSDEELAALRSGALPRASVSSVTGDTQRLRPTGYDIVDDEVERAGKLRIVLLVAAIVLPIAIGVAAWTLWPRGEEVEAETTPTAAEAEPEPEANDDASPTPEAAASDRSPALALEDDDERPTEPAGAGASTGEQATETPEDEGQEPQPTQLPEPAPAAEPPPAAPPPTSKATKDPAATPRRPRKPKADATPAQAHEPVPANLPGFGPGNVPP